MTDKNLRGKVAFVTGGASGMGRAISLALASAGCDVVIGSLLSTSGKRAEGEVVFLPSDEQLWKTAKEIEDKGVKCLAHDLDVTSTDSVKTLYDKAIATFKKIDILVNAAGITAEQTVCGHSETLWQKVMQVNVDGVFRTTRLCLPGMMERGFGRVINIASTAASVGAPTSAAYCASKAAVVGFTKCVALEGAERGVSANTISPGWVETSFGKHWMGQIAEVNGKAGDAYITETKASNPQKRMIQPEEIGALAAFLCRDEAFGITMQDLTVSAGSLW